MKLKTRLAVTFLIITVVPMALIFLSVVWLSSYQAKTFSKEYGLSEQVDLFPLGSNSMQIFNRLTERAQSDIREMLNQEPEKYEEPGYLDAVNAELNKHYAYLIVRKGDQIIYCGDEDDTASEALCRQLLEFDPMQDELEGGIYLDGENQHLIKQMDFTFPDNQGGGSAFIVSNVDELVPEMKSMMWEIVLLGISILMIAGIMMTIWVYSSILSPLNKLQEATKKIRDGNLEFTLDVEADDEIGQLCQDFEEMRLRLKENAEEKLQYDRENKELH